MQGEGREDLPDELQKAEGRIGRRRLKEEIEERASRVTEEDVGALVERKAEFEEKEKAVPGSLGKFVNQIGLLFRMLWDYRSGAYRAVPWKAVAMAAAAVLYFLSPVDLIPDFIPGVGYADDALVTWLVMGAIREALRAYCEFKGYDPDKYF
ncbi:MAG: hypothetical protein Kow0025_05310 [Thermodesulfovibrionales bacterium]